jgi:hypothetical protein
MAVVERIHPFNWNHDLFLKNSSREHRHIIIGTFAVAVRQARFSRASHERLAAGTVNDTVQYVCTTFRESGYPNPSNDDNRQPAFILQWEFRLFKNTDPEEKHQKALPISVISELIHRDSTELKWATGKLATAGIFFAMRSCEYLKVAKQTRPTKNRDLQAEESLILPRSRTTRTRPQRARICRLHRSHIKTTEEGQKMDMVTLMDSQDAHLCPVRAAAAIVRRIRKYPGSSKDSSILTVIVNRQSFGQQSPSWAMAGVGEHRGYAPSTLRHGSVGQS